MNSTQVHMIYQEVTRVKPDEYTWYITGSRHELVKVSTVVQSDLVI